MQEAVPHANDDVQELVSRIDSQIAVQERKIRAAKELIAKLKSARRSLGGSPAEVMPFRSDSNGFQDGVPALSPEVVQRTRRHRKGSEADTVIRIARKAIEEAGRPLKRNEIVDAVVATGYKFKSANPPLYVNKLMGSSGEFRRTGSGYYFANQTVPHSGRS